MTKRKAYPTETTPGGHMPSTQTRRALLASLGATASAFAGCSATPTPDDPPPPSETDALSPANHVYGATGEWASRGCNAANTRRVEDGQAPVDGIAERWERADVTTTPLVRDRLYVGAGIRRVAQ